MNDGHADPLGAGDGAKLRILHLYKDCFPVKGGIENHLTALSRGQAAAGHDVTVLVANRRGAPTATAVEEGVRVIRAKRWATLASTPISPAFFRQAGRIRADITHLHFPHPPGELAWLWRRPSPRAILTFHCDVVRQQGILRFYRPFLKRVFQRVDRIIVGSPPQMDNPTLEPFLEKCSVVPLGIDIKPFSVPDPEARRAARARLGLPADGPVLLFVGVLRYYKSLETVLEAMPRIPPAACFVAVGDGPMREAWERQAAQSPAARRIRFAGKAADETLVDYYRAADVFLLPSSSRAEAFGLVLLEAMATGVPCITTEVGTGTSWVNLHGSTGVVVAPQQPRELAEAVTALLAEPARRREMGLAARRRVEAHFTDEVMMASLDRLYRETLSAPPASTRPERSPSR